MKSGANRHARLTRFLKRFHHVVFYLLLAAPGASFVLNEPVDGFVISVSVLVNAIAGLFKEAKAEKAIGALRVCTATNLR